MSDNNAVSIVAEVVNDVAPKLVRDSGAGVDYTKSTAIQRVVDESFENEHARLHTFEVAQSLGVRAARAKFAKKYLAAYR